MLYSVLFRFGHIRRWDQCAVYILYSKISTDPGLLKIRHSHRFVAVLIQFLNPLIAMVGHVQLWRAVYSYGGPCIANGGPCIAVEGHAWLWRAMYSYGGPFITVEGHVWLWWAMYMEDHV